MVTGFDKDTGHKPPLTIVTAVHQRNTVRVE